MRSIRDQLIALIAVVFLLTLLSTSNAQQQQQQQHLPQTVVDDHYDHQSEANIDDEPPEGYYAFIESPSAVPPKVRPPPYTHVKLDCKELHSKKSFVSVHNLCGDLNKGQIPRNPMQQNVLNEPYPFELIRNQTLRFLSKTLPVLKADDTLPKVTQVQQDDLPDGFDYAGTGNRVDRRMSRMARPTLVDELPVLPEKPIKSSSSAGGGVPPPAVAPAAAEAKHGSFALPPPAPQRDDVRVPRKFCDNDGVFCTLYRAINGDSTGSSSAAGGQLPVAHAYTAERREEILGPAGAPPGGPPGPPPPPRYDGPPTPCPAKVEYATPVFAKNYQGSWRYVVQIPYEGYFTQTVEVTRCLQARCHYLDGGCLSSPRWVSLLVAEIFYPNADDYAANAPLTTTTTTTPAPPVQDFQAYQQYLQRRAGLPTASDGSAGGGNVDAASAAAAAARPLPPHCDGHDEIGCFQVRLYYDWFLIPGSCKCWRPDYFARYVRRKPGANGADL